MAPKKMMIMASLVGGLLVVLVALRRGPDDGPAVAGVREKSDTEVVSQGNVAVSRIGGRVQGLSSGEREQPDRAPREREPGPTRTLTGRVMLIDGTPLPGATVYANRDTTATTDADGRYELTNLPSAIWRLAAAHNDAVTSSVRRIAGDQTEQDFYLLKKQPVTFVGKVVHHSTKQPIGEFGVVIRDHQPVITPGKFEITGLFSGDEFSFRIEAAGFAPRVVREELNDDASGVVEQTYELGAGGVVKGRIVRSGSKSPLEGVGVRVQSFGRGRGNWGGEGWGAQDNGTSVPTEQDGTFTISMLPPGQVRLQIEPESPLIGISRFAGELRHDEVKDVGDIEIGEGGTIRGRLIRVPGDTPVSGEQITLGSQRWGGRGGWGQQGNSQPEGRVATTGADGNFEFTKVPPGYHRVTVPNFDVREAVGMEGEEVQSVTLRVGSGELRGLLLKDGKPVQGEVEFSRQSGGQDLARAEAGEDGAFRVRGLAPGFWKVNIDPEGGRDVEMDLEMPENGAPVEKVFNLPSSTIIGKVLDAQGEPVAGATISVMDPAAASSSVPDFGRGRGGWGGRGGRGGGIESQGDGSFRIGDREPGALSLTARKDGMGSSDAVTVQVPESGESSEIVLRLRGDTGTLVSTALNLDTGQPVRDAWTLLNGPNGRLDHRERRGEDGVMTISDIPAGTYQVQVSAMGHTVSEQSVEIRAGERVEITDVISPAGALRWTVVDQNGAGVGGIRCTLTPNDGDSIESPREGVTDASGLWSVRGLMPGNYTVTVHQPGKEPVTVPVQINAGGLARESTLMN